LLGSRPAPHVGTGERTALGTSGIASFNKELRSRPSTF
jgi:hypothetical protein